MGDSPHVESRVKWTELSEDGAAVGHVGSCPELSRAAVLPRQSPPVVHCEPAPAEPSAKPAYALKQELRFRLELVRHHKTGDHIHLGVICEQRGDGANPLRIHHTVVIRKRDDITARFEDRSITGPVEARTRLTDVANSGKLR